MAAIGCSPVREKMVLVEPRHAEESPRHTLPLEVSDCATHPTSWEHVEYYPSVAFKLTRRCVRFGTSPGPLGATIKPNVGVCWIVFKATLMCLALTFTELERMKGRMFEMFSPSTLSTHVFKLGNLFYSMSICMLISFLVILYAYHFFSAFLAFYPVLYGLTFARGFWDGNAWPDPGWLVAVGGLKKNGGHNFLALWGPFEH